VAELGLGREARAQGAAGVRVGMEEHCTLFRPLSAPADGITTYTNRAPMVSHDGNAGKGLRERVFDEIQPSRAPRRPKGRLHD